MTYTEKAYAKLNLTLDVLGLREDGYHDLKSVMQTVSLGDDITVTVGTGKLWQLTCSKEGIPCDQRNLAWKAASMFCEAIGKDPEGIAIHIEKRIPSGAGMGGGSADAAAVLRVLNRHFGNPMTDAALADFGARIGSDVPFCVIGGTVMCEGRGERLRVLRGMPLCPMVICKPEFSVSTPELYRKLDSVQIRCRPDNGAMEAALETQDLMGIARNIGNVFDPVVAENHPEIGHIKSVCQAWGALATQMTGSGSVVFAIMPDGEAARKACAQLENTYAQAEIVEPV